MPAPRSAPEASDAPRRQPPASSAPALPGGDRPSPDLVIKGNADSMIYHSPESPSFARTTADVWFRSERDAEAAGYRPPRNRGRSGG